MLNQRICITALLILLSAAHACPARAAMKFSLLGIASLSKPDVAQPGTVYSIQPRTSAGLGFTFEIPLNRKFGIEFGGSYVGRKYLASATLQESGITTIDNIIYQIPSIELPVFLRFWPVGFISLGVGGYYALGFNRVTITDSQGRNPLDQSFADTNLKQRDYGLAGSLKILIPLKSWMGLLLEGQYLYGIQNNTVDPTPGESYRYRDIHGVVGFSIGGISESR